MVHAFPKDAWTVGHYLLHQGVLFNIVSGLPIMNGLVVDKHEHICLASIIRVCEGLGTDIEAQLRSPEFHEPNLPSKVDVQRQERVVERTGGSDEVGPSVLDCAVEGIKEIAVGGRFGTRVHARQKVAEEIRRQQNGFAKCSRSSQLPASTFASMAAGEEDEELARVLWTCEQPLFFDGCKRPVNVAHRGKGFWAAMRQETKSKHSRKVEATLTKQKRRGLNSAPKQCSKRI